MSESYLRFWGVRGSYAAPFDTHIQVGGNTSCVELRDGEHVIICDGGTGIIPLGQQLLGSKVQRDLLILLTHYHWDHICGLPFFTPAFLLDWHIRFFGPGQDAEDVAKRLADQMKAPFFPVETGSWAADIRYLSPGNEMLTHGNMLARHVNVHHPGVTFGYHILIRGKRVVYVSDNEFCFLEKSIEARYDEFDEDERPMLDQMRAEARKGDLDIIRDADILIHDAQYTPEDYAKKRGWGHSCIHDTVNCAIDANVKVLYLFHHEPTYNDEKIHSLHQQCLEIIRQRGAALECHIAREGLIIPL